MAVGNSSGTQGGGNRPDESRHAANPPRATIVVLDDDLLFRRGVARVLRSERYDVIEVDDTEQLAETLRSTPVDLIVADSRLSDGSDGWREALTLARQHGRTKVLAMTGYDKDAIAAVGGFTDVEFVQKSGAGFNVVAAVEAALAAEP